MVTFVTQTLTKNMAQMDKYRGSKAKMTKCITTFYLHAAVHCLSYLFLI